MACTVAHRFSVVTVIDRVVPMLEDVVARYGLRDRCASVRGTPLAVLDIERDPTAASRMVLEESRRAIAEDRAEAICLGCAGMGTLECEVRDGLDGIPVIDGVAAAVKMLEGLVGLGLGTSRRAAFMEPGPKELTGSEPFLEGLRERIRRRRACASASAGRWWVPSADGGSAHRFPGCAPVRLAYYAWSEPKPQLWLLSSSDFSVVTGWCRPCSRR